MKHAFVFPGQGAQFTGMGKTFYDNSAFAKKLFEQANEILGFRISDVMFTGSEEDLKQTAITQPAVFIHSVIAFKSIDSARPDMVAGHSLGEFSALVANGTLSFEDGLKLVSIRAQAMQKACEQTPSTMAAVLNLADEKVEEIACEKMKEAGAKRALILPVGGAFHSPLMEPAKEELKAAIEAAHFNAPACPVYQNVVARGVVGKEEIKQNLINQLTGAVKWTQCVQAMIADGASKFTEAGPGKVLQGLILKINKEVQTNGVS